MMNDCQYSIECVHHVGHLTRHLAGHAELTTHVAVHVGVAVVLHRREVTHALTLAFSLGLTWNLIFNMSERTTLIFILTTLKFETSFRMMERTICTFVTITFHIIGAKCSRICSF